MAYRSARGSDLNSFLIRVSSVSDPSRTLVSHSLRPPHGKCPENLTLGGRSLPAEPCGTSLFGLVTALLLLEANADKNKGRSSRPRTAPQKAWVSQRLQYPLIKEYSLNHDRDPTMISGIFLNSGILVSLGSPSRLLFLLLHSGSSVCSNSHPPSRDWGPLLWFRVYVQCRGLLGFRV